MSSKICPACGKEFTDLKHPNQQYCSRKCHTDSFYKFVNCPGCGVSFRRREGKKQKYCTAICGFKNRSRPQRDPSKTKTFTCIVCDKSFETWAYRNPTCCSRKCASTLSKDIPKPTKRKPEIHIVLICVTCGKEYRTNTHHVRLRGSAYCSRKCMGEAKSQTMKAAGNPNYRGGTITYRGGNWGKQKRAALERDGYCCQICRKKVGRKNWDYGIHHIVPYREFNGDYKSANQLANLITLCRSCHARVEWGKLPCPKRLFS